MWRPTASSVRCAARRTSRASALMAARRARCGGSCARRSRRRGAHALHEAAGAGDAGLRPDHVALGRAVGEHEPARAVRTPAGDDVVRIDEVLLRLRHLLGCADDGRRARAISMARRLALALDAHVSRQQPAAVLGAVGLVRDHALREQRRERLAQARVEVAGVGERAREEARVEQVQDRVLDAADVLVDGQPGGGRCGIDRRLGVRRGEAHEIPGAVDERVHRVRFARRWPAAGRALHVLPGRVPVEVARLIEARVLRQLDGQSARGTGTTPRSPTVTGTGQPWKSAGARCPSRAGGS